MLVYRQLTVVYYQDKSGLKCVLRLECHSCLTLSRECYAIMYQIYIFFKSVNANPV